LFKNPFVTANIYTQQSHKHTH